MQLKTDKDSQHQGWSVSAAITQMLLKHERIYMDDYYAKMNELNEWITTQSLDVNVAMWGQILRMIYIEKVWWADPSLFS